MIVTKGGINIKYINIDDYLSDDIDEFLKLDDGMFSHEVIFPSGSSYYVEFKGVRIE